MNKIIELSIFYSKYCNNVTLFFDIEFDSKEVGSQVFFFSPLTYMGLALFFGFWAFFCLDT